MTSYLYSYLTQFISNIYYFLFLCISISICIPFHNFIIHKVLCILLFIYWILSGGIIEKIRKVINNHIARFFVAFFLIYCISYFFSENKDIALDHIILYLPILLFSLIFPSIVCVSRDHFINILKSFVIAVFFLNFYSVFDAFISYFDTKQMSEFIYYKLTISRFHPTYQSMFISFSTAILFYFKKTNTISLSNILFYSLIILNLIFILLLQSAIGIFIFSILFLGNFVHDLYCRNTMFFSSVKILLFLLCVFSALYFSPILQNKYSQSFDVLKYGDNSELILASSQDRFIIWKSFFILIQDSPLFGYGSGDAHMELQNQIKKESLAKTAIQERCEVLFNRDFNYHNQYFQILCSTGILGLFFFVMIFIRSCVIQVKEKNYLFLLFSFIFLTSCMTESILQRQLGIYFFSFFTAFLSFYQINLNKPA